MKPNPRLTALLLQLKGQTRLYNNVLSGLEELESNRRMSDRVNNVKWVAGHLLSTRYALGRMVKLEEQDPYLHFFPNGTSISDTADYPPLPELLERWNRISPMLVGRLAQLPDSILDSDPGRNLPFSDGTLLGNLAFLIHHEAYHIGQLALLRKWLGKEAMKYS